MSEGPIEQFLGLWPILPTHSKDFIFLQPGNKTPQSILVIKLVYF